MAFHYLKGATFAFVKEERVILISYLWSTRLSYAFLDFFITYNLKFFFFLVGVDGQIGFFFFWLGTFLYFVQKNTLLLSFHLTSYLFLKLLTKIFF